MTEQNTRFICVHGHFYQPPRENPWLEDIEVQDSAHPFHDWNERIFLECYAPNTASRLLDRQGMIEKLINNYEQISFNFGPTLLGWMAQKEPEIYQKIIDSHRIGAAARTGHGNALSQVFNHIIMPLASRRDKVTQVVWGIRDFERRYGQPPEGMWLSETAVDSETLEVLADAGIQFTVLAPHQGRRIRPLKGKEKEPWQDVSGGRIDPSRPYAWRSPEGKKMNIFFYDGPISRAIAFENLLENGEYLVGRLMGGFSDLRHGAQLVNVATDGESYGHHKSFGDMALAYALQKIQDGRLARLTNYAEFLALHPPELEVEVVENSSWSCSHGIERWRSDCGCRIGFSPPWNQKWRGPLRQALDGLRDELDRFYEEKASPLIKAPWLARNDYVDVILDRREESRSCFLRKHQTRSLTHDEQVTVWKLLEMQRHRLYMYTSCGWFFDEISGLESVTILSSAARALQLGQELGGGPQWEQRFLELLEQAPSNIASFGNGANVYRRLVKPQITDLSRVAAHQALQDLFQETSPKEKTVYCYNVHIQDKKTESLGRMAMSIGQVKVASSVTHEIYRAAYVVLHLGGHDFHCFMKSFPNDHFLGEIPAEAMKRFSKGSLTELLTFLAEKYEPRVFHLQDLFLEDRRRILTQVIRDVLGKQDSDFRRVAEENRKLINYLLEVNIPIPDAFRLVYRYVLDRDRDNILENWKDDVQDAERMVEIKSEAEKLSMNIDFGGLAVRVQKRLETLLSLLGTSADAGLMTECLQWLKLAERLELGLNLWRAENLFHTNWAIRFGEKMSHLPDDDPKKKPFYELARCLRVSLVAGEK